MADRPGSCDSCVEDRMYAFLARVPLETVRRKMALLAPGRPFESLSTAEVVHLLGVAGVASLANVEWERVLEAAGPEACSIADLIDPAPYGNFPDVGRRYVDAAPMLQDPNGGYIRPGPAPYAPPIMLAQSWPEDPQAPILPTGNGHDQRARDLAYRAPETLSAEEWAIVAPLKTDYSQQAPAPEYSPELVSVEGVKTYEAPSMAVLGYEYTAPPTALPREYTAPTAVAAAPVYAPTATTTATQSGTRSFGTTTYGTTAYSAPTGGARERSLTTTKRSGMRGYFRNPGGLTAEQESSINQQLLAMTPADRQVAYAEYQAAEGAAVTGVAPTPAQSGAAISGWPAAPPFRPDAWNFSTGVYTLQQGDTFSGLSALYLESPGRYMEIWSLQPYRYDRAIDPSSAQKTGRPLVTAGTPVKMPDEATERAKELVRTGAPTAPTVSGGPGGVGAPWSTGKKVAVGVGVVAVLGLGGYALSR